MTVKRLVLSILSFLAIATIWLSLLTSWSNQQVQTRLDLLQTDLVVQATEWKGDVADNLAVQKFLFDGNPKKVYEQALESYQEARASIVKAIAELNQQPLADLSLTERFAIEKKVIRKQNLINEFDLHIGLLKVKNADVQGAIATWQGILKTEEAQRTSSGITAEALLGLWSNPSALYPNAEGQIRRSLSGWYRNMALEQLYRAQQRLDLIPSLQKQAQIEAASAVNRILIANTVPLIGGILGILLWIVLGIQWLFFRKNSPFYAPASRKNDSMHDAIDFRIDGSTDGGMNPESPDNAAVSRTPSQIWTVLWDGETTWEVIVLWFATFIAVSQFVVPLGLNILRINYSSTNSSYTDKALFVLIPYILSMLPILAILQICLERFRPLPKPWFEFNPFSWRSLVWGIGGYLAAVPMVVIASMLNEQVLRGQGGGNPLLPILVESHENFPKLILWSTIGLAAPFFEELIFRGFLLPSLTKFMPVGGAIAVSAFCFALAHLNLGDLIPLTVLGMVLGFVYVRSRNLLAPMLLHCLWNSGSFVSLLALGGN
jgi:uncharacterized protein